MQIGVAIQIELLEREERLLDTVSRKINSSSGKAPTNLQSVEIEYRTRKLYKTIVAQVQELQGIELPHRRWQGSQLVSGQAELDYILKALQYAS